jgi:hypothetical protein
MRKTILRRFSRARQSFAPRCRWKKVVQIPPEVEARGHPSYATWHDRARSAGAPHEHQEWTGYVASDDQRKQRQCYAVRPA